MSQRWRNQRALLRASANTLEPLPIEESGEYADVVEGYAQYEPGWQELSYYLGGNTPQIESEAQYPGQREYFHTEEQGFTPPEVGPLDGLNNATYNLIDREIGGQRGRIDQQPYSTGVTSSSLVENFELDGAQAIIRRQRNPADHGPVGTSDYNGGAALRFALNTNQYYPNEASQADLVRAV